MEIKSKIGEYFYGTMKLDDKSEYSILQVPAKNLFCSERLDLIVKYLFLDSLKSNGRNNKSFEYNLYNEHLKKLNDGVVSEPGNDNKNSIEDYVTVFDRLYDDIKAHGFDENQSIIPCGNNNVIIDGGHRVTTAAYLGQNVTIAKFKDAEEPNYNADYFLERGMKLDDVDCMVYNYANYIKREDTFVCCVWPIAGKLHKDNKIESLIKQYGKIVYKKKCKLNYNGLKNMQILAYSHQDWVGTPNDGYEGVGSKTNMCFANADTTFYVIEGGCTRDMVELKDKIRDVFNIGKHSVHITDNYQESLTMLRVVLNKNSLWIMNNCKLYSDAVLMDRIKNETKDGDYFLNPECTLALFGKKDANTVDLKIDQSHFLDYQHDYSTFFWLYNRKFLVPKLCEKMTGDVLYSEIFFDTTRGIKGNPQKAYLKIFRYKTKKGIIDILNKTGLLDVVYKMYKQLRG